MALSKTARRTNFVEADMGPAGSAKKRALVSHGGRALEQARAAAVDVRRLDQDRRRARSFRRAHSIGANAARDPTWYSELRRIHLRLKLADENVDHILAVRRPQPTLTQGLHELGRGDRTVVRADQYAGNGHLDAGGFGDGEQTRQLLEALAMRQMLAGE